MADIAGAMTCRSLTLPVLLAVGGCHETHCDVDRIESMIRADIEREGRQINEFKMEPPRKDGALVYVGMAVRINDLYRWHYWIDPRTCRIVETRADQ